MGAGRYPVNALVAPTTSGTQLSWSFTTISCPSDSNGSSFVNLYLYDPSGTLLNSWTSITTTGGSPYTYYNAGAVAGLYSWDVEADVTPSGSDIGGTYNCTFTYSLSTYILPTSGASAYVLSSDGLTKRYTCADDNVLSYYASADTYILPVFITAAGPGGHGSSTVQPNYDNFTIGLDLRGT